LPDLGELPLEEYPVGEKKVSTTVMGSLVAEVGKRDKYLVSNADGNEASQIANINQAQNHPPNSRPSILPGANWAGL